LEHEANGSSRQNLLRHRGPKTLPEKARRAWEKKGNGGGGDE